MGFDPASLLAEATAVFGTGSAATGATAATAAEATAAAGTAAAGTAATGAVAAGTAGAATAGAAAGLSSSTLLSLGTAAVTAGVGTALAPKPPKPAQAPGAPSLFGANQGSVALLGDTVGDAGGTFLSGNNRAPQISGGKKTLLGQ